MYIYIYIYYMYVAVCQVICACSVEHNVGGVKCGPLSKALPLETNTKNVLKWIRALWLLFNIQSSDYGATDVVEVSLYSTFTRSTLSFGYV